MKGIEGDRIVERRPRIDSPAVQRAHAGTVLNGCTIGAPVADLPNRAERHDFLIIALCAVICGADSCMEVERFGRTSRSQLETLVPLLNRIPAHDTFGRVFAALHQITLTQLQRETTANVGEKTKRRMCRWDARCLATVLMAHFDYPGLDLLRLARPLRSRKEIRSSTSPLDR